MVIKKVEKLSQSELNQVSILHQKILTESFINNFGLNFLKISYSTIFESSNNICFLLKNKSRVIGFLVATINGKDFNKEVIKNNFLPLSWEILKSSINKPRTILNIFSWIISPTKSYKIPPELQFIAIDSKYQNQGFGKILMKKLSTEFINKKIKNFRVGTKTDNNLSNNFYKKIGFKYIYQDNFFGSTFNYYLSPNLF